MVYSIRGSNNEQFIPSLYAQPLFSKLKQSLIGVCDLQDEINQMYTGLNYIDVLGMVGLDHARSYLPSITSSHTAYFNSIDPKIQIQKPAEIISVQYELQRGCVISRLYYKVYANTPQPLDSFNYQIQNTQYKIKAPAFLYSIVARGSFAVSGRADLITRVQKTNKNLILKWLPHFFIEVSASQNEITLDTKLMLESVLVNFWQKVYMKQNKHYNKIEIQLITNDLFYEFSNNTYASRIYYMISVNDFIKYNNQLPQSQIIVSLLLNKIYINFL